MARIAGIDIPRDKRAVISLTYVYGVGQSTARDILNDAGVSVDTRVRDLTEDELSSIRKAIGNYTVEGDLRRDQSLNVKRLIEIGSYKGIRRRRSLPVRGQKTKNNARTVKGPRRVKN